MRLITRMTIISVIILRQLSIWARWSLSTTFSSSVVCIILTAARLSTAFFIAAIK